MWEPRHLTTLLASTACYGDSFAFFTFTFDVLESKQLLSVLLSQTPCLKIIFFVLLSNTNLYSVKQPQSMCLFQIQVSQSHKAWSVFSTAYNVWFAYFQLATYTRNLTQQLVEILNTVRKAAQKKGLDSRSHVYLLLP
jgi:hypothetical protein